MADEPAPAPAPAVDPAPAPAPQGGDAVEKQTPTLLGGDKPAEAPKAEDKPADKPGDKPAEKPAALAATDFKLPDGFTADEAQMGSFLSIANELGLSKEAAQKLVDLNAASVRAASEASSKYWADLQKEWQAEATKTYGPEPAKNPKIIAVSKAIDSLGEKPAAALREALDMSGMGNHPAVIAAFAAFAERLSEPAHAKGSPPGRPATAAQAIYPNMNQG